MGILHHKKAKLPKHLQHSVVIFKQESSRKQHHKPSNQPRRTQTTDAWWLFPPNLFCQYHIWDIFGLGLKSKVTCGKNKWMMEIMDKGLTVSKMGAHALIENTPNTTPNLSRLIFPICPKVWEIVEKKELLGVRSPWRGISHAQVKLHTS